MISRSDGRICANAGLRAAGFTLFEMLIVIAIMGLMTTVFVVNIRTVSPATHARAAAQQISGALRSARSEAVMTNRSVWFTLDLVGRSYQSGQSARQVLPGDLGLALLTSRDELASGSTGRIRFDPDGGSSGGRVSIAGGGRTWWVGIDWLSGRVRLVEAPR